MSLSAAGGVAGGVALLSLSLREALAALLQVEYT